MLCAGGIKPSPLLMRALALFELIEFHTGFAVVPTLPVRIVLAALAIGGLVLALT